MSSSSNVIVLLRGLCGSELLDYGYIARDLRLGRLATTGACSFWACLGSRSTGVAGLPMTKSRSTSSFLSSPCPGCGGICYYLGGRWWSKSGFAFSHTNLYRMLIKFRRSALCWFAYVSIWLKSFWKVSFFSASSFSPPNVEFGGILTKFVVLNFSDRAAWKA